MLILIMGVSGTGKSVIGKALADTSDFEFIDADSFHSDQNISKMAQRIALSDADRFPWLQAIRTRIKPALKGEENIILACSALKQSYRDLLLKPNEQYKIIFLFGSKEIIKERLTRRENHFMNPNLLDSQFATLEEPDNALAIDVSLSVDEILNLIYENRILGF